MPVYQVDIEKSMALPTGVTYFWTNVWHINSASQAAADSAGAQIVVWEKAIHATNQQFIKMRVRPVSPTPGPGSITALTGTGGRAFPADMLPAYNTVRVDFSKAVGRPCRKYFRINLGETEQSNGIVAAGIVTSVTTNVITPAVATGWVCDDSGDVIISGTVLTPVQMRQLRRGSKRKIGPVI